MAEAKKAKLLIVDDETALMRALCNTLGQQGYECHGVDSGPAALAWLEQSRCALMLTDLMMPGMDGLGLARRALQLDASMVVVMMTGEGSIASAVEALQSGVLDYVLKPFKLSTMLPVIERALTMRRLRGENSELQARVLERTAELEQANRELEAYAHTVSHDLRAPLRDLGGLTQLLAQRLPQPVAPETRQVLDLIETCTQRSQRLVEDLLRLSRLGRQPLRRTPVNVDRLVQSVLAELQTAKRQVAVTVEAPLPPAFADLGLLRQVFVNLLGNAWKFTQDVPDAQVTISSTEIDDLNVYIVADNGVGFDMAVAHRLFRPFERLDGAEAYEGSGVGLSIVQRIVQRHGGRIWAESAVGSGSRFYFTLGSDMPG